MRQPFQKVGRICLLVLLCLTFPLASRAVAQPGNPRSPAETAIDMARADPGGIWRSTVDSTRRLLVVWEPRSIELICRGEFVASAVEGKGEFVGIARRPDAISGASPDRGYQFQVIRVGLADARSLRICFGKALNDSDALCETWERESAAARASGAGDPAGRDAPLPRYGDYVYVEELPEPVERVQPQYPDRAREKGIDGTVNVQVLVGTDGLVKDVRVVKSIPELDESAVACVRRWRFKPARAKGQPVAVWVGVPVKFTLH